MLPGDEEERTRWQWGIQKEGSNVKKTKKLGQPVQGVGRHRRGGGSGARTVNRGEKDLKIEDGHNCSEPIPKREKRVNGSKTYKPVLIEGKRTGGFPTT